MSESEQNFILNKAKNVGDAYASTRLFNEVQYKICRLQPFNDPAEQVYCYNPGVSGYNLL